MKRVQRKLSILMMVLIITYITLCNNIVYAKEYKEEKLNVLFIGSYNSNFISFEDQVEGIKAGLENNVNLRVEYMDLNGYYNIENEEKFYNLLKSSFENYKRYDAIIAGDDEALEFCLKYRNDIFQDIPISFLGIQKEELLEEAFKNEKVSGVREIESIEENLKLITEFHPKTENIIFLNDSGDEFYENIVNKYSNLNFQAIITSKLTRDEFKETIKKLKDNSVIISLYPDDFNNGEWLKTSDINKLISEINPTIPIYSVLNYGIGTGSVGGKVINHFNQGKKAAEIVLGLLEDKDEKELYIDGEDANEYIFDYDILKKLNIKINSLPKGSQIINNPIEMIRKYKTSFIILSIIFATLILLILALIKYIYYKRKYEKEIINAKNKAEEANKLKAHFIANISHELNTPINVILCAAQLMESKDYENYKDNGTINVVKDNCYRLMRLINNIIDVEKAELNDLKLNLENSNLVNLAEELVMSIIPYAEKKNLNLTFDTNEEEVIMNIDVSKIERVILNLVSNAIKFSKDEGNIYVTVNSEDKYVNIIVEDNGVGISQEDICNIFENFMQVDNSLTRKNEGSGIGLSIAKSLVELHDGDIIVESEINKGTKFTVRLPKKTSENYNDTCSNIEEKHSCEINMIDEIRNIRYRTRTELSDIYI